VAGPDRYLTVTKSSRAVGEHDRGAREDGRVQKRQQDARLAWGRAWSDAASSYSVPIVSNLARTMIWDSRRLWNSLGIVPKRFDRIHGRAAVADRVRGAFIVPCATEPAVVPNFMKLNGGSNDRS